MKLAKSYKKYLFILLILVTVLVVLLLIMFSPRFRQDTTQLYGNYIFKKKIHVPAYSSKLITDDYVEYYTFTKDTLIITDADGNREEYAISYQKEPVSAEAFAEDFYPLPGPDISGYQNCYLMTDDEGSQQYRVYAMDDELWIASFGIAYITNTKGPTEKKVRIGNIFQIVPYDGEVPSKTNLSRPG